MRSISTLRGDTGETSLAGGVRVSKASIRVEAYGNVDELNSSIGFARSICEDADVAALAKRIQQDLFKIGSSLATPTESPKPQIVIETSLVDALTLVRLQEAGEMVQPSILGYLNRLSDLLWLFGRKLEHAAGVSGSLRDVSGKPGNRFSRAW